MAETTQTNRCPFCTAALSSGTVFCPYCKRSTNGSSAVLAASPSANSPVIVVIILILLGVLWGLYSTYLADPRRDADASSASVVQQVQPSTSPTSPTTDKPTMPADVKAYLQEVGNNIHDMAQGSKILANATHELIKTPSLALDKDWKFRAGVGCSALMVGGTRLENIQTVPQECEQLHQKIRRLAHLSKQIATEYAEGVDNLQASRLKEAFREMNEVGMMGDSIAADITDVRSRYADE